MKDGPFPGGTLPFNSLASQLSPSRARQTVARLRLQREAAHESAPETRLSAGESIVPRKQLEAATSNADPLAGGLPLTKQDKAASRLLRKLNERSRQTSPQGMAEIWRLSEPASARLETRRQSTASSSVGSAPISPSVLAAPADPCTAATAASSSEA